MNPLLSEIDVSDWVIKQSLVFDWYDGPRHGVCVLENQSMEIEYKCIAERYNPDGMDHRLFSISEMEYGSVAKLSKALSQANLCDLEIAEILDKSRPTQLIVYSFNFVTILAGWRVDMLPKNLEELLDQLGIGATTSE